MYGAQTPMYGSQTPLHDGEKLSLVRLKSISHNLVFQAAALHIMEVRRHCTMEAVRQDNLAPGIQPSPIRRLVKAHWIKISTTMNHLARLRVMADQDL